VDHPVHQAADADEVVLRQYLLQELAPSTAHFAARCLDSSQLQAHASNQMVAFFPYRLQALRFAVEELSFLRQTTVLARVINTFRT